jgi:magnesium chelatase accessory protein
MDWARDGRGWPHADRSRLVEADGRRWFVQQWAAPSPTAPRLLLLHGTGASSHSWRALAPLLAAHAGVTALDLPGHGFSDPAPGSGATLEGMALGVAGLLRRIDLQPTVAIGHSAGAAIAVRLALDRPEELHAVIGLNAALLPLRGLAGQVFSPLARLLAANRLVPHLFAWRAAAPVRVRRLLAGTGSMLDDEGVALYGRLVADPAHVAGALAMMAHWDLPALARVLPSLRTPLHLLVGERDRTVPPADAERVRALVPGASVGRLPGLGHLAHEEQPRQVLAHVLPLIRRGA